MKTLFRITLVLGLFIAVVSTNSYAQSPLVELQAMEATLNADIAATQASITSQQNLLATVVTDLQIATDEGDYDAEVALTARQTSLNTSIADLQAALAQLQADLATVQSKIPTVQSQLNMLDKNWVTANVPVVPAPADPRIVTAPDINNPNTLNTLFVSTGSSVDDAEIVHQWLVLHGLAK